MAEIDDYLVIIDENLTANRFTEHFLITQVTPYMQRHPEAIFIFIFDG